jgi:site-specific DNA-methyltransferase (adenine-specific)
MINKVYNEDCLTGMQRIPDNSVDMILCDLPYGTTACKWDVIIPFEPLWKQYERVIKDNGAIVLTASQPFTSALVMSNVKNYKHRWIWNKKLAGNFAVTKYMPLSIDEDILVFGYGKVNYMPQMREGKIRQKGGGTGGDGFNNIKLTTSINNTYHPVSILEFHNTDRKNSIHPSQKPVALFEYLIKTYANEGETVLDNCMGSGTTAIACINTGRNYIGFEKEEKYYNIIQERIKKHTVQLKLIA